MPGAASPEEAVFTGADDPTASPVAQEFIKKLQAQGLPANATNMRRLIEANARNIGEDPSTTGPDPVPTVRNDRVENSAQPAGRAAPRQNPPNVNLGGNPYGDEGPATNPGGPAPFVDPATGILMTDQGVDPGTAIGPALGSAIVAGLPFLKRFLGGSPNLSGVTLNPTPGALPAPPPVAPPQIAAPQARLPPPGPENTMTVRPPTSAPTTSAPPPPAAPVAPRAAPAPAAPPAPTAPPVINMPPPPNGPVQSPSMIRGTPPAGKPDPAILDRLKGQIGNRLKLGAGIPFIMESPQEIMSRWKK